MVTTRKNSRAASDSEEPRPTTATTPPKKQAQERAASTSPTNMKSRATPKSKRRTEELVPGSSKEERPVKQAKKTAVEGMLDQGRLKPLKQATPDQRLTPDKPQEGKDGDIGKGAEEGTKDTEMAEATDLGKEEDKEAEEDQSGDQLKAESKSAVSVSSARGEKVENSPIMEKGIMYFFFRSKVAVEHAESLDDAKRSFIVLRPLPLGAELKGGKVKDEGYNRLIVVPKKKLPTKGYERFLTFVEEPEISVEDLRNKYLKGSTYMTKTQGERTNSPMELIGEGIYAITKSENERSSHLAYILTPPQTPDEFQKEFGLKQRGSFNVNVRNPETPAPSQAGIPDPAEFPKEIMDEFCGLRWGALEPKHLEYKHAEVLFIGEKNIPGEEEHEATTEEMEKLEGEDEIRVKHLCGNEAVFTDLELDKKGFAEIESLW